MFHLTFLFGLAAARSIVDPISMPDNEVALSRDKWLPEAGGARACPSVADIQVCSHTCSDDTSCPDNEKCCPTSCGGSVCLPPVTSAKHKGLEPTVVRVRRDDEEEETTQETETDGLAPVGRVWVPWDARRKRTAVSEPNEEFSLYDSKVWIPWDARNKRGLEQTVRKTRSGDNEQVTEETETERQPPMGRVWIPWDARRKRTAVSELNKDISQEVILPQGISSAYIYKAINEAKKKQERPHRGIDISTLNRDERKQALREVLQHTMPEVLNTIDIDELTSSEEGGIWVAALLKAMMDGVHHRHKRDSDNLGLKSDETKQAMREILYLAMQETGNVEALEGLTSSEEASLGFVVLLQALMQAAEEQQRYRRETDIATLTGEERKEALREVLQHTMPEVLNTIDIDELTSSEEGSIWVAALLKAMMDGVQEHHRHKRDIERLLMDLIRDEAVEVDDAVTVDHDETLKEESEESKSVMNNVMVRISCGGPSLGYDEANELSDESDALDTEDEVTEPSDDALDTEDSDD